ncbi:MULTISPECIES: hypothetical protein [unclassified Xanthobacter]|uniref:hypothetical protein n=1 Tax=unclassified Xanthobacter TaxID=2623496 RepID=UPI001EE1388A|nr:MULTISPECIES: hypothetical protein [unclassified Xanthobacter]
MSEPGQSVATLPPVTVAVSVLCIDGAQSAGLISIQDLAGLVGVASVGAYRGYQTYAEMVGDLTAPAGTIAEVTSGAVGDGGAGRYLKTEAGAGGWTYVAPPPLVSADVPAILDAITITGSGLASGGGSIAANRTIDVAEASEADAAAMIGTGVMTGRRMAAALANLGRVDVIPNVDDWREVEVDATGRIVKGQMTDLSSWIAVDGDLVRDLDPTVRQHGGDAPLVGDWREVEVDATGRIVTGWQTDGTLWRAVSGTLSQVSGGSASGGSDSVDYDYQYTTGHALLSADANVDYMIIVMGQSWAGGAPYSESDPTVTTTPQHPGAALMFDAGSRPQGALVSSYVDLAESVGGSPEGQETVCSGMADVIMTTLQANLGRKPRIIWTTAARDGTAYYGGPSASDLGLKRGSATYNEAMRLVRRGYEISGGLGRKLEVLAVQLHHGEQDFSDGLPEALYGRALDQLQMHLEEDIRKITGQTTRVRMYAAQTNRAANGVIGPPGAPALAVLAAEDRNPMIRCVGPSYQSPPASDHAHLLARGYRWLGCLDGRAIVDDLFGPYQRALRVVEAYWQTTTTIRLRYSKALALETTDDLVLISTLGAGRGVTFADGSGSPPTVTGIALVSADTIEVTLSAAPTGLRPRVFVAAYRTEGGSGSTEGPRSAIRSATAFYTDTLTSTDLYYWACHETITLPNI